MPVCEHTKKIYTLNDGKVQVTLIYELQELYFCPPTSLSKNS